MLPVFLLLLVVCASGKGELDCRFTPVESTAVAAIRTPEALTSLAGGDLRELVAQALQACALIKPVMNSRRRIRFAARRAGREYSRRAVRLIHVDGIRIRCGAGLPAARRVLGRDISRVPDDFATSELVEGDGRGLGRWGARAAGPAGGALSGIVGVESLTDRELLEAIHTAVIGRKEE